MSLHLLLLLRADHLRYLVKPVLTYCFDQELVFIFDLRLLFSLDLHLSLMLHLWVLRCLYLSLLDQFMEMSFDARVVSSRNSLTNLTPISPVLS